MDTTDNAIKTNTTDINAQIRALVAEAESIKKEIVVCSSEFSDKIDVLSKKVDKSVAKLEKVCLEMDQIDEAADVAIDEFVLDQVKNLTEE